MDDFKNIDNLIITIAKINSIERQSRKVIEEMFELGLEISHNYKKNNKQKIVEELVDVINSCEILLQQLTHGNSNNTLRIIKLEKVLHYSKEFKHGQS